MFSNILQKTAFLMPFIIGTVIIAVILWYARVRQPIKRLRAPFGQLLLLGNVLMMVNGAIATFIAKAILSGDKVAKSLTEEKKKGYAGSGGTLPDQPKETERRGSWDRIKYGEAEEEKQDAE